VPLKEDNDNLYPIKENTIELLKRMGIEYLYSVRFEISFGDNKEEKPGIGWTSNVVFENMYNEIVGRPIKREKLYRAKRDPYIDQAEKMEKNSQDDFDL